MKIKKKFCLGIVLAGWGMGEHAIGHETRVGVAFDHDSPSSPFLCTPVTAGMTVYVDSTGCDDADGSAAHPLQTLPGAQKRVRTLLATRGDRPQSITVQMAAGVYHLEKTLVFSAEDSGTATAPVVWAAAPGAEVVISGGRELTLDWQTYSSGVFKAQVPSGIPIDQLFVNGQRQVMARYPNFDPKAQVFNGTASDCVSAARASRWADPTGGFMHAMHSAHWGGFSYRITGKNDRGEVQLEGGWQGNRASAPHPRDRYVENIFEELDAPGEWFFDEKTHTLFFMPPAGVDLKTAKIEVASLRNVVEFRGEQERPVRFVTLKGVTLRHTVRTFMQTKEPLLRTDWTICRAGAVFFEGAEDCHLEGVTFDQIGGNAVFASHYNRRLVIRGCHIFQAGAGGVMFVGDPAAVRNPLFEYGQRQRLADLDLTPGPKTDRYPADCLVEDCLIHEIGRVEKQATGVGIDMAARITVRHCSIYDMPRAGINIGDGCWGGHVVEYCDVFDTVKETGDHGSFNAWGRDRFWGLLDCPGERLPALALLDATAPNILRKSRWRCDHGWDIDLDDGSSHYEITDNLLLHGGLKLREGFHRKVSNNIIINNGLHPHCWYDNSGDEVTGNLFMAAHQPAGGMPAGPWGKVVDRNFFVSEKDRTAFAKNNCDAASASGSPLFVDPASGDFRFKPGSPALAAGLHSLDVSQYGVQTPRLKRLARTPETPMLSGASQTQANDHAVWLHAAIRDIGGEAFSAYGVERAAGGIAVESVPPSSPADKAGLRKGDLMVSVNGAKVGRISDFLGARDAAAGKPLVLGLVRDQKPMTLKITGYAYATPGPAQPQAAMSGAVWKAKPDTRNEAIGSLSDGVLGQNYGPVFANGTPIGLYQLDLGAVKNIGAINTWTYNQGGQRAAQRFVLYVSSEDPGFDLSKCQPVAAVRHDATGAMVSTRLSNGGVLATGRYLIWAVEPVDDQGEHSAFQELGVELAP